MKNLTNIQKFIKSNLSEKEFAAVYHRYGRQTFIINIFNDEELLLKTNGKVIYGTIKQQPKVEFVWDTNKYAMPTIKTKNIDVYKYRDLAMNLFKSKWKQPQENKYKALLYLIAGLENSYKKYYTWSYEEDSNFVLNTHIAVKTNKNNINKGVNTMKNNNLNKLNLEVKDMNNTINKEVAITSIKSDVKLSPMAMAHIIRKHYELKDVDFANSHYRVRMSISLKEAWYVINNNLNLNVFLGLEVETVKNEESKTTNSVENNNQDKDIVKENVQNKETEKREEIALTQNTSNNVSSTKAINNSLNRNTIELFYKEENVVVNNVNKDKNMLYLKFTIASTNTVKILPLKKIYTKDIMANNIFINELMKSLIKIFNADIILLGSSATASCSSLISLKVKQSFKNRNLNVIFKEDLVEQTPSGEMA